MVLRIHPKKTAFLLGLTIICLTALLVLFLQGSFDLTVLTPNMYQPAIVLDAGHGGMDGGATGINGVAEKDINLGIALKLEQMLQVSGFQVVMTRREDCSIHDKGSTIREQKVSDMRNRLKLAQDTPNAIFISIHQNHFTQSKYYGAQMFYSVNNPLSKALAQQLQLSFTKNLQPDNKREIKPSGKDLYLLYHLNSPAVLVECGFLSNPDEAALLSNQDYQQKVAFTVLCGIIRYCQDNY